MDAWFEVENFKSIKKTRLHFAPFMVLVGPNGVGKTNIVQAMELGMKLLDAPSPSDVELLGGFEQLARRAPLPAKRMRFAAALPVTSRTDYLRRHRLPPSKMAALRIEHEAVIKQGKKFRNFEFVSEAMRVTGAKTGPFDVTWKANGGLRIREGDFDQITEELGYPSPSIRRETKSATRIKTSTATLRPLEFYDPEESRLEILKNRIIRGLPAVRRLRFDSTALRAETRVTSWGHDSDISTHGEGLPLAVEDLRGDDDDVNNDFLEMMEMLRSIYPQVVDVRANHYMPGRVALAIKEKGIGTPLGDANVSDGFMHVLAALVALYQVDDDILVLEEPENALHPWALRNLLKHMQSMPRNQPLIITTHSPVAVNAIADPNSLFLVDSTDHGTEIARATDRVSALRKILSESGEDLGDMWLDGSLGGVPKGAT